MLKQLDIYFHFCKKMISFSIAIAVGFALDGINSADQYERLGIAYEKSFNELSDAIRELEDDKNDIKTNEKVFLISWKI